MADGLQIAPESTGPTLDTKDVGARGHREVTVLGDPTDVAGFQAVLATDPAALDYGGVVRQAPPDSPITSALSSSALAVAASVDLDPAVIPTGSTGKLYAVLVSSSAPAKWTIKKVAAGGGETTVAVLFTTGISGKPSDEWKPASRDFVTQAGNSSDTRFRVSVVNLHNTVAADVYATFQWDEI